jgi:hypothetical protein
MPHLIFTSQASADAFSAGIDAEFGYPRPNVVTPGGAAAPRGQTVRYAAVLRHPVRNQWAYPEDPVIVGKEVRVPIGTATRQDLDQDATWKDATSNFREVERM